MKTEYDILYWYLTGSRNSSVELRLFYEAKFGSTQLSWVNCFWPILYLKDNLSVFGFYANLRIKLLYLTALIEVTRDHESILPNRDNLIWRLMMLPVMIMMFLIALTSR